MDLTSTFAPITKTAEQGDGSLLVYGKATDDSLDLDEQRCDAAWLKTAMPQWFDSGRGVGGNIREQHRADSAIGKAIEHEAAEDGHYITARIVDPLAIAKTRAGIFTGFSIGIRKPKIVKSDLARNGLIKGGTITEVSLVDRPANSNAILTLCKSAKEGWHGSPGDLDEERGLVRCEELLVDEEALAKAAQVDTIKVTNVERLDAPAPGQKCGDCGEGGHLTCGWAAEFDRAKAIELVESITKAADGLGQDESGDISGADQAIATIARLIISEAQGLAKMPSQDCDIHLLMSAVDALRYFSRRERAEQDGVDPDSASLQLAADVDIAKGKYSAEELRSMLGRGQAFRNANGQPSYPIGDKEDLFNAIHAVGRGGASHDAIRAYIIRRAKALGASDMIPDNWSSSGSNKAVDSEVMAEEGKQTMTQKTETSNAGNVTVTVNDDKLDETVGKAVDEALGDVAKALNETASTDKAEDTDAEKSDEVTDTDKSADADIDMSGAAHNTTKAAGIDPVTDPDSLIKAFTGAFEKEDSPLRKMFVDIVEASTEITAKSLSELGERLVKVEQMATPGGPALRRTEAERVNARRSDLLEQSARYKVLASKAEDPDLRKGYTQKAVQIDAEIKAL
jgi:hypothetical protein